jgi:hypothetical protein
MEVPGRSTPRGSPGGFSRRSGGLPPSPCLSCPGGCFDDAHPGNHQAEELRVVAHFADGTLVKGTVVEFQPGQPTFQLRPQDGGGPLDVRLSELKAVFFVKDLKGRPQRRNIKGFLNMPGTIPQGNKIAVRFKDGEFLCGFSHTYSQSREGFFMFPADSSSNNLRVYVVVSSTTDIKVGPAADILARSVQRSRIA